MTECGDTGDAERKGGQATDTTSTRLSQAALQTHSASLPSLFHATRLTLCAIPSFQVPLPAGFHLGSAPGRPTGQEETRVM